VKRPARPDRPPIGRDREAADLASALTDRQASPVVLHGLPGMGGIDLARWVWHSVAGPGSGVRVVDAEATGPGPALLDLLGGAPDRTTAESPPGLVVLDRADEVIGDLAALTSTLRAGTRLLARTIRRPSRPGPGQIAVGPLPVPESGDDIEDNAGVRLFLDRAGLGAPGAVADDDLLAAAEICRIAAGWPLLIEAIACWAGSVPPDVLVDRLGMHPEMLFQPAWDSRHPTRFLPSVRAALERTWTRLSVPERSAVRAAALFRAAVPDTDLAAVAGLPIDEASGAIGGLCELGLLVPAEPGRWRATPVAAEFARHKFDRHKSNQGLSERVARRRYLDVVCARASQSLALFDGGAEAAAARAAADDIADYLPAMDLLREAGRIDRALRLAGDAAPGLSQAGRYSDAVRCIDRLLRAVGPGESTVSVSSPAPSESAEHANSMARSESAAWDGSAAWGDALIGYADLTLAGVVGMDVRELAVRRLRDGVAMVRRCGTPLAQLRALAAVCNAWPVTQDLTFSARCVDEGLALAQQLGDARWSARFEAWAGMLAHQQGNLVDAVALGAQALARARRCNDRRARLLAGILLQTLPEQAPDIPGGVPDPEQLLTLASDLVEPRLQSVVLAILADRAVRAGRWDAAAYWCAQALELVGSLDTWYGAGFAVMFLVAVAAGRGEPDRAATLHGMVLDRLDVLAANMPPHAAQQYRDLVASMRAAGDPAEFDRLVRSGAVLPWRDGAAAALQYAYRASASAAVPSPRRPAASVLTPREAQVLGLIARGQDARTIAESLHVSARSVSHHTGNVLHKLGVRNRTQAAIWATQHPEAVPDEVTRAEPDGGVGRQPAAATRPAPAGRARPAVR
jgi:DNA-binding CsgD family transcriptional regulator